MTPSEEEYIQILEETIIRQSRGYGYWLLLAFAILFILAILAYVKYLFPFVDETNWIPRKLS
jgi:hypothetical protein